MRSESRGKRARKLYAITSRGRQHFLKMLAEPSPPVFVHDEAQVKIYFGHHNPKSALAHLRRMRQFDEMWARELSSMVTEVKARGENPFRTVLLEIGQQLTAFKARMEAKLELGMAREISLNGHRKATLKARATRSENRRKPSSVQ
jgi:DNA-binding PadR family transcriptional regulator